MTAFAAALSRGRRATSCQPNRAHAHTQHSVRATSCQPNLISYTPSISYPSLIHAERVNVVFCAAHESHKTHFTPQHAHLSGVLQIPMQPHAFLDALAAVRRAQIHSRRGPRGLAAVAEISCAYTRKWGNLSTVGGRLSVSVGMKSGKECVSNARENATKRPFLPCLYQYTMCLLRVGGACVSRAEREKVSQKLYSNAVQAFFLPNISSPTPHTRGRLTGSVCGRGVGVGRALSFGHTQGLTVIRPKGIAALRVIHAAFFRPRRQPHLALKLLKFEGVLAKDGDFLDDVVRKVLIRRHKHKREGMKSYSKGDVNDRGGEGVRRGGSVNRREREPVRRRRSARATPSSGQTAGERVQISRVR